MGIDKEKIDESVETRQYISKITDPVKDGLCISPENVSSDMHLYSSCI